MEVGTAWSGWTGAQPDGWCVCLIFRCTIKSRSSPLVPAHLGGSGKRAVKRLWCGVVVVLFFIPRLISAVTDWMSAILLHIFFCVVYDGDGIIFLLPFTGSK